MEPLEAQQIYNFSDLTSEAQRILFLRGLVSDEAAQQLATATGKDIGTVRNELISVATQRCQQYSDLDIALYWLNMKFQLVKPKEDAIV